MIIGTKFAVAVGFIHGKHYYLILSANKSCNHRACEWWANHSVGCPDSTDPGPVPRPEPWIDWFNQPLSAAELDQIKHGVNRGTPYGSAGWVSRTAAQLGLSAKPKTTRTTEKRNGNVECPLFFPAWQTWKRSGLKKGSRPLFFSPCWTKSAAPISRNNWAGKRSQLY